MSQLLTRSCTPETLPVMLAVKQFVDANVSLFAPIDQADAQGNSAIVSYTLLVELPSYPAWRGVMTSIVPMMQAFVAQIHVSGVAAKNVQPDKVPLLAGRLYEQGTSILFEAFRVLHPNADHTTFMLGLFKERGLL